MAQPETDPTRGGLEAAAAPSREAGGAFLRHAPSWRRAGGNSQNYPGVSVTLIQCLEPYCPGNAFGIARLYPFSVPNIGTISSPDMIVATEMQIRCDSPALSFDAVDAESSKCCTYASTERTTAQPADLFDQTWDQFSDVSKSIAKHLAAPMPQVRFTGGASHG